MRVDSSKKVRLVKWRQTVTAIHDGLDNNCLKLSPSLQLQRGGGEYSAPISVGGQRRDLRVYVCMLASACVFECVCLSVCVHAHGCLSMA